MLIDVTTLLELQIQQVELWHKLAFQEPTLSPLFVQASRQHHFNFQLWHQEDLARDPQANDSQIAQVKRNIDKLNQQRNDAIEKVDEMLIQALTQLDIAKKSAARLNSETPGSILDRLSINALKIFHMEEETQRKEAEEAHREKCRQRVLLLKEQRVDLSRCLQELLHDLVLGDKTLKVYRQMKMYNDATLNPVLYAKKTL